MFKPTIGRKLGAAVATAVVLSSCVTSAVAVRQEFARYVASRRDNLLAAGQAFASASSAALAAGDERAVFGALRGIGGVPHLLHAAARDRTGRVLADTGFGAQLDSDPVIGAAESPFAWAVLRSRTLGVVVPVTEAGRQVGSLELLSDAGDIWDGLLGTLAASLAGGATALAVGLAIAAWLQHSITRPLRRLTAVMAQVRDAHDYSISLPRQGDDEVGTMVAGFNAMLADIHERDDLLLRHRDRLEEDVRDRTRDLALAKDGAERANAAKSTFLATMSHEIRTPMTGLLVMAELLASGDLPARSRRYAEVISRSGTALLAIINDILDFSKIEAGKLSVERVPVDIRDVVGTVVTLFQAKAAEKKLDLAAHIAVDVPATFSGDPVRLQQVVGNLVNNALKFTQAGHVLVEVVMLPSGELELAVSDSGIGIEADKIDAVFEAFAQADGSTTRRFGGTGLGLSIAGRLAVAMGGRLAVASEVGVGSRFACTLPVDDAVPPARWPRLDAGRGEQALVAIAGAGSRRIFARMLEDSGYAVRLRDPSAEVTCDGGENVLVIDGAALGGFNRRTMRGAVIAITDVGQEGSLRGGGARPDVVLKRPVLDRDFRALLSQLVRGQRPRDTADDEVRAVRPMFPAARVLVVDDTAVNREVMVEALRNFGIVPDLAGDGFEALRAAEAVAYDLIFMDGSMPGLDGFEACRRLRAAEVAEGRARVLVLALTAHVVGEAARTWEGAGMDGVLHKPFTLAELEGCLAARLTAVGDGSAAVAPVRLTGAEAAEGASEPLLDAEVLDGLADMKPAGSDGFARRVLGLYRAHAPEAMARVRAAAVDGCPDDLAAAAHALRSMSVNIGARRVGRGAGAIEAEARAGTVARSLIERLDSDLAATLALVSDRLASATPQDAPMRRAG